VGPQPAIPGINSEKRLFKDSQHAISSIYIYIYQRNRCYHDIVT
jgi:hypothetical protein